MKDYYLIKNEKPRVAGLSDSGFANQWEMYPHIVMIGANIARKILEQFLFSIFRSTPWNSGTFLPRGLGFWLNMFMLGGLAVYYTLLTYCQVFCVCFMGARAKPALQILP